MKRSKNKMSRCPVVTLPVSKPAVPSQGDEVPQWLRLSLQRMYSEVMTEPIPQDLLDLLQQLQAKGDDK